MHHGNPNEEESENVMEVETPEEYVIQVAMPPSDNIHPLALIAINVDPSENTTEGASPTASTASSRAQSPVQFAEESESAKSDSKKRTLSDDEEKDEGALCPICLDNWANTGDHRICSLKCGHLFGYKCITRWLNTQRKKSCPTCKEHVSKNDIRYIYAKKLTAVDTTELDNMKNRLDLVIDERNKALTELAKCACREHSLTQEITRLKSQLSRLSKPTGAPKPPEPQSAERVLLYMDKSLEICKFGGSRVFDAKCDLNLLMASVKSPSTLFTGFGLKKISISDYRHLAFIPLHNLQIRDICFHPENNWVLTASMDKSFKVVDNNTNSVIHHFSHQMPLWSCCWDLNNPFILYVGAQFGSIIKYDVRNLSDAMDTLSIEGDMSPVVSVASIPAYPGGVLPQGGVISCKLNSIWLYENLNGNVARHSISLEGPFVSMKYQASSKQLLVSSRPNSRITYSRHTLSTLSKKQGGSIDCNIVHSFQGGGMQKLLSKSCFLSNTSDYVAAHQENSKSVYLWSINTGEKVCSVAAHESVFDLKGLTTQNGIFLVSLTEKKLDFFKFV